MIVLPKCRALYFLLEKGHGAGKRAWPQNKRAWHGAILKQAGGNTMTALVHMAETHSQAGASFRCI